MQTFHVFKYNISYKTELTVNHYTTLTKTKLVYINDLFTPSVYNLITNKTISQTTINSSNCYHIKVNILNCKTVKLYKN